jgi:hypothetical protein
VRVKSQVRRREGKGLGVTLKISLVCPSEVKEREVWNFWNFRAQTQNMAFAGKFQISLETDALPYPSNLPNMKDSQKLSLPSDVTPCISMPVCP